MNVQEFQVIDLEFDISTGQLKSEINRMIGDGSNRQYRILSESNRQIPQSMDNLAAQQIPEKNILIGHIKPIPRVERNNTKIRTNHLNYSEFIGQSFSSIVSQAQEDLSNFINDSVVEDAIIIIGIGMDESLANEIFQENAAKDNYVNPIDLAPRIKIKIAPLNQIGINVLSTIFRGLIETYPRFKDELLPYIRFELAPSTEFGEPIDKDDFYGLTPPATSLPNDWFEFREEILKRGGKLKLGRIAELINANYNTLRKLHSNYQKMKIVEGSIEISNDN
ncbi:hypothetical protein [Candidatus Leptofilum sp.]|uniref:hypothetical protein n=1 Tax=Candidatus Leptofilum sp. TaxID=3241576 RepID=UPI003B5ACEEC